jgi:signal transduction histidine kinase
VDAARLSAGDTHSIRHLPSAEPILASFDPGRLEQAARILLDNAVKYTPQGGEITVKTARENGHPRLEVSDTGIGVKTEEIPRIFDRFYRTDEARSVRGTGLGLSIARQIAEALGGTLTVRSVLGKGSTFILQL